MKDSENLHNKDEFKFFVPSSDIFKAEDKEGNEQMYIEGIASSDTQDTDGEVLDYMGFEMDEFAFINWNHNKTPGSYIGEPIDWQIKPNQGLWIKGKLFPDQPLAIECWNLGNALKNSERGNQLGFSIEGRVIERDPSNPKKVVKAKVTAVAVCPHPKNADTFVDFVKKGYTDNEEWEYVEVKDNTPSYHEQYEENYNYEANGGNEYVIDIVNNEGKRITVDRNDVIKIIDKAFSAEAANQGEITTKEHVEGDHKYHKEEDKKRANLNKYKKGLDKAEIIDKIFQTNSDLKTETAKDTYKIIKNMAEDKNNITENDIQKAFDKIKQLSNLDDNSTQNADNKVEKGEEYSDVANEGQEDLGRTNVEGSSSSDGGQENVIMDMIQDYMGKGYGNNDIVKKMEEAGYDKISIKAAMEKAYNEQEKSNGTDFEKSDIDKQIEEYQNKIEELKKSKEQENSETMEKSQVDELKKSISESVKETVSAETDAIKKSVNQLNETVQSNENRNKELEKSINEVRQRLEAVENQPSNTPKSVMSKGYQAPAQEQINKSQQSASDKRPIQISDQNGKNELLKSVNQTISYKDDPSSEDMEVLKEAQALENKGEQGVGPKLLKFAEQNDMQLLDSQGRVIRQ